MNDLEICKSIAEIEGFVFCATSNIDRVVEVYDDIGNICGYKSYDPLNDNDLCFQLMKKHKISLVFNNDEWESEFCYEADVGMLSPDEVVSCFVSDKDANRAVCLAIIEAHS